MSIKTQVLGLGNAVLCDDSAGIQVLDRLKQHALGPEVTLTMGGTGGLALVDMILDCDRLVIVDAIMTGAEPGAVHKLGVKDLESAMPFHMVSSHGPGLLEIFRLREALLDLPLPREIIILAIEAADTATLSETCTPEVEKAVARVADQILNML
ncbi:MAG: hydrogenase maturation protease [Desulfatibacillum sp.]|nr:hydrogenase maturation protease [Desulfatibacillum sp.]